LAGILESRGLLRRNPPANELFGIDNIEVHTLLLLMRAGEVDTTIVPRCLPTFHSAQQYGLLKLHVQMYIPHNAPIWYQPCVRPGERVPPPPVDIVELFVDFQYPVKSGVQKRLEEMGYRVSWANASRLASLELDGWEVVIEKDGQGRLRSFYLRDPRENQVLSDRCHNDRCATKARQ
jgi:hypothetical protein